ncbi:hypothetical protein QBC33DRAFT_565611 [Phialemonium atrogriseum]|uniref:Uncharacterized protein n=1 Tax=Phialemonium atrogriseum TaxID=1093897 RepID=A0AAJ0C796_9PEZI|nr:uncharacterized protein QBC33DRAFT_565611 [Phialemonium atrogriseum]KAK1771443.1 hypothetical protein QBC33DRAFT_565611 [Phialemonium atrogriseum]
MVDNFLKVVTFLLAAEDASFSSLRGPGEDLQPWIISHGNVFFKALQTISPATIASLEPYLVGKHRAASIYGLQRMDNLGLKADDTFVLCDAGGESDRRPRVLQTIASLKPHVSLVGAGGSGSGGLCGSSYLNRILDHHLRQTMRDCPPWRDRWQKWAIDRFEKYKESFTGNSKKPLRMMVEGAPQPSPQNHRRRPRNPSRRSARRYIRPVITNIKTLVRKQIDETARKGTLVKQVLLAGGFGKNPYLLKQLREMVSAEGIQVPVISNSNTAIVRGALIARLAGQLGPREGFNVSVASRPASQHYGTQCYVTFDAAKHGDGAELKERNPSGEGYRIYVNQWWVNKSEMIADGACKEFPFTYSEETIRGPNCALPCKIFTCEAVDPPKTEMRNGVSWTVVPFKVEMQVLSASLKFTIVLGDRQPQKLQPETVRFESSNDIP